MVKLRPHSKQKGAKTPACSIFTHLPRGTPLLWRGWGRFQYPLSAAHNLPVKRRKHVKLLKTYCIFFAIISIYVTFARIFRNRYLLKVFDQ